MPGPNFLAINDAAGSAMGSVGLMRSRKKRRRGYAELGVEERQRAFSQMNQSPSATPNHRGIEQIVTNRALTL